MSQEPVFELQGVSYGYSAGDVLHGIQVRIPAQKTILITGPNGSGKTTLLKLLAGVLTPRQGRIYRGVDSGEMAGLGHDTYIYPGLTVLENLSFWRRLYRKSTDLGQMESILQRVGLDAVMYEPASHMSRGMAQRLSLARVLSLSAKVLLLDEPMAGLDADSQTVMRTEVDRARRRGATVLWITHTPEAEIRSTDYVLRVGGGSVRMEPCAGNG
ncbi:MAG: ABC transporter ATP-binding protein [Desulfovermiculus sp.]|nr:ABC transporter ATP-binding protein [Desulfovermiculus sp.]